MLNWIDKHLFFDAIALGQIITAIFAALISIISLNKDFRAKTKVLQREARVIKYIIIILTLLSISNIFVSTYDSHADKKALNDSLAVLRRSSDSLRATLNKNSIKQSNLITISQRQSAADLKIAANSLRDAINGSDSIPIITFVSSSSNSLFASLINNSSKPIYNILGHISNYDQLIGCKIITIKKVFYMSTMCIDSATLQFGEVRYVSPKGALDVPLPLFESTNKKTVARYNVSIRLAGKDYEEQVIYKIINNVLFDAVRVIEFKNRKPFKIWFPKRIKPLKFIDWKKEFPLNLFEIQRYDFKS